MKAPHVYIGRQRMNDYALSDTPMLAGLNFDWGTDSQVDFEDPGTLSAEMLVREPSTLDFLVKGAELGVLDPDSGETLFAGRITTLRAKNHPTKKGALVISITAADTGADISNYRVERVDWTTPDGNARSTTAHQRRAQLAAAMPAGWTLEGNARQDWTVTREQRWEGHAWLPLLDMHLRTTIGRRHNTSRYIPGTGLAPRITITPERSKDAATERLAAYSTGRWYMSTTAPGVQSATLALGAGHVENSIEWEKTPDDTVTDIALTTWGITYENDPDTGRRNTEPSKSKDMWVGSNPGVNMGPMQRAYGFHQQSFDVDYLGAPGGSEDPTVANIVNYWLDADTQWRPTSVIIPDSRRMPDSQTIKLLSTTRRYNAYATIDGLPANNPAGGSRVRGYIIAGSAEWTGKKWVIELTLGRVPGPAPDAGRLTFASIKNHSEAAINAGTAQTVGTALSFADFAFIGD